MRRTLAALALVMVVGGGVACGGDDGDGPTEPTSGTGSEQPLPSDEGRGKEPLPGTSPPGG